MRSIGRFVVRVLGIASLPRVPAGLLVALGLICSQCQADELLYDGFQHLVSMQREVRDVVEVNRDPLFDNAAFLHLRQGDKLVKAKQAREKGKPSANPDKDYYFLLSGGKYFQLWTTEQDGKLLLSAPFHSAHACLLFDWEPTLANAQELRKLLPLSQAGTIPLKQYEKTVWAIREQFPDLAYKFETFNPPARPDRLVTIPGQMAFEFEGLSYDYFSLRFHCHTVRIGPHVCQIVGQVLLQGPPRVERSEFERVDITGPNGSPGQDVDPKIAKVKKAAYDRMQQFQTLVTDALAPALPKPK